MINLLEDEDLSAPFFGGGEVKRSISRRILNPKELDKGPTVLYIIGTSHGRLPSVRVCRLVPVSSCVDDFEPTN